MDEILPQIHHWTTQHEGIGMPVSSFYLGGEAAALVDPRLPDGGTDPVAALGRPQAILLSNRHHLRHAESFAETFGCPILCHEEGLHEFEGGGPAVGGFSFGSELRPGVTAIEVGAITPEETALHIDLGDGALAFADAIIHYGDEIEFVPDFLLGDDPEAVKRGVCQRVRALLDLPFDAVLFAHGDPITRDGKTALERFLDRHEAA